jgi:parvulin-like peptidyl-prolyl isomerase
MTKKQRSRASREARTNQLLILGAAAVGLLVVGVLAFGYVIENVIKPRQAVAYVNSVPISVGDLDARYSYFLLAPEYESYTVTQEQALGQLVRERLVAQEAERLGLSISEEEIDQAVEIVFGFDRQAAANAALTQTSTLTPALTGVTEEEYNQRFEAYVDNVLDPSGLGINGFRRMLELYRLESEITDLLAADITTAEQVNMRYFSFSTLDEAIAVIAQLDTGDDWETIVEEIEADETSSAYGSELVWRTQIYLTTQFGEDVSQVIMDTAVGERTDPLAGAYGNYYLFEVVAREERELDELMLAFEQERAFYDWLELQMENVEYVGEWQERMTPP